MSGSSENWALPRADATLEDADSPTGEPFVHVIVPVLPRGDGTLPDGALPKNAADGRAMGRNSFLKQAYEPPDPPPGHGPQGYAFEVFALEDARHFRARSIARPFST
jgi:phosphatidylethanolamine-binding protein (PEBP) family uncharacterized protein